jgi:hypothetical protein
MRPMFDRYYGLFCALSGAGCFIAMALAMHWGALIGARNGRAREAPGTGAVEGGVLGLLGLLIALTFSGAVDRIDRRAVLTIDESDAVGTAFQRLDVLSDPDRSNARSLMREYLAARVSDIALIGNQEHDLARERTLEARDRLWTLVVAASSRSKYPHAPQLTLPLLNESFDIAERREAIRRVHPPWAVYMLLLVVAMLSAGLAGFGMADHPRPNLLHRIAFCGAIAVTLYVALDMERPRYGFIRMGERDKVLTDTLADINRPPLR